MTTRPIAKPPGTDDAAHETPAPRHRGLLLVAGLAVVAASLRNLPAGAVQPPFAVLPGTAGFPATATIGFISEFSYSA